jgi:hypothetical protein
LAVVTMAVPPPGILMTWQGISDSPHSAEEIATAYSLKPDHRSVTAENLRGRSRFGSANLTAIHRDFDFGADRMLEVPILDLKLIIPLPQTSHW